jgi:hypothetical protein
MDEPFGPYVSNWRQRLMGTSRPRLAFLCAELGLRTPEVQNIRYQLLHRTVSALVEAERFNAQAALMLVHSFHEENVGFDDYGAFVQLLDPDARPKVDRIISVGERRGIPLYLGWVADV